MGTARIFFFLRKNQDSCSIRKSPGWKRSEEIKKKEKVLLTPVKKKGLLGGCQAKNPSRGKGERHGLPFRYSLSRPEEKAGFLIQESGSELDRENYCL